MSGWEWVGFAGTLASILGLFSWVGDRRARQDRHAIHTATQQTLKDMQKGFQESQERLGQILERMDQGWREAMERMDRRADERHREVMGRLAPGGGD
jgi:hypothetical protein